MRDHPETWVRIANDSFRGWVLTRSRLVERHVSPIPRLLVREVMAANIDQATTEWSTSTLLLMGSNTSSGNIVIGLFAYARIL